MDHAVNCGRSKLHEAQTKAIWTISPSYDGADWCQPELYVPAVVMSVPVALSTDSYLTEFVLWV